MINENQKVYMICEDCSKKSKCEYYAKVKETITNFIDTPLNIHFANCKYHQSVLNKMINAIECREISFVSTCNPKELSEDFKKYLINTITKNIEESIYNDLDK